MIKGIATKLNKKESVSCIIIYSHNEPPTLLNSLSGINLGGCCIKSLLSQIYFNIKEAIRPLVKYEVFLMIPQLNLNLLLIVHSPYDNDIHSLDPLKVLPDSVK